jgi:hypothetical protein
MQRLVESMQSTRVSRGRRLGAAALWLAVLLLCGCHKGTPSAAQEPADAKSAPAAKPESGAQEANRKEASEGVVLTPEQLQKLGLVTAPAQNTDYREEAAGYGVVVNHESIAQGVAELTTARATARQTHSALARAKQLAGTPGAVSAEVEEAAIRQAAVDAAALKLTTQRQSATLGLKPPWKSGDPAVLEELANGTIKLVRVTFPIGTLSGATPASLRAAHLGAKPGAGWEMTMIWDAPADASVPGKSFFAILKGGDAGEGERLQVWAPIGEAAAGVVVPASAVVMSEGKYWCYLQSKPGTFVRTQIDTRRPTREGYFVTDGVHASDQVVTSAAGQLLAKESASGAETD